MIRVFAKLMFYPEVFGRVTHIPTNEHAISRSQERVNIPHPNRSGKSIRFNNPDLSFSKPAHKTKYGN